MEAGDSVLLLTGLTSAATELPGIVNKLTEETGASGKVQVEHIDRLCTCKCLSATSRDIADVCVISLYFPHTTLSALCTHLVYITMQQI